MELSSTETNPKPGGISRRAVIGSAAWSVPAIALSVAAPAHAASAGSTIVLNAPTSGFIGEDISSSVVVTVRSANGIPLPGESVLFTVDPISVGAFPNGASSFAAVTDSAGTARAVGLSLLSAGTLTVTAANSGHSDSASLSVAPSDGAIAMTYPTLTVRAGSTFDAPGVATAAHGLVPSEVQISYSSGLTGPATATVNAQTGAFTVAGVTAPNAGSASGTITAAASRFGSSSTSVTAIAGWILTESSTYRAYVGGTPPTNVYTVRGQAFPLTEVSPPAALTIAYPPNVNAGPTAVTTNAGAFTIPDFTPAAGHRNESGSLNISAPGWYAATPTLVNTAQQSGVTGPAWQASSQFFTPGQSRVVTGQEPQPGFAFVAGDTASLTYTGGFTGPSTCTITAAGTWIVQVSPPTSVAEGAVTIQSSRSGSYKYSLKLIAA